MEKIELVLELEKETKNTYRYAANPNEPKNPDLIAAKTIYIQKVALPEKPER